MFDDSVIIRYKINKDEKMRIFGSKFVKTNKSICKLLINDREEELIETYNTNTDSFQENEIFEIKLIGISNVTDMSKIFYDCKTLYSLPDNCKWNTSNVINMNYMFYDCKSLVDLSVISHWNISKVTSLNKAFAWCQNLNNCPDISKWDTSNVTKMKGIFCWCTSLTSLPDI